MSCRRVACAALQVAGKGVMIGSGCSNRASCASSNCMLNVAWLRDQLCMCCCRPEYVTVSTDGSVRIWDAATHQQLFEFGRGSHSFSTTSSSSSTAPCRASCAAFSPAGYQLAVGFNEGVVRLFDIATAQLLQVRSEAACPEVF